jgi:hypothetical protein
LVFQRTTPMKQNMTVLAKNCQKRQRFFPKYFGVLSVMHLQIINIVANLAFIACTFQGCPPDLCPLLSF